MSSVANLTPIGYCAHEAAKAEEQAKMWRAMEKAMGLAYAKLDAEERGFILEFLSRASPRQGT